MDSSVLTAQSLFRTSDLKSSRGCPRSLPLCGLDTWGIEALALSMMRYGEPRPTSLTSLQQMPNTSISQKVNSILSFYRNSVMRRLVCLELHYSNQVGNISLPPLVPLR